MNNTERHKLRLAYRHLASKVFDEDVVPYDVFARIRFAMERLGNEIGWTADDTQDMNYGRPLRREDGK